MVLLFIEVKLLQCKRLPKPTLLTHGEQVHQPKRLGGFEFQNETEIRRIHPDA